MNTRPGAARNLHGGTPVQWLTPVGRLSCARAPATMANATARLRRWLARLTLVTLAALLAGCAGMRIVDSDVRAFSANRGVELPASYRFERLPSQQTHPDARDTLEAIAQDELARVGMQRDDIAPRYSVMIELHRVRDPRAPWDDPPLWGGFPQREAVLLPNGAVVFIPIMTMQFDIPYYRRELQLLVRRLSDGLPVFESRARHDGRWSDDAAVLPAMFEAALRGFPDPPQGLRHIEIEIPR